MTQNDFKIGDRIKVTGGFYADTTHGKEYVILLLPPEPYYVEIMDDVDDRRWLNISDIELIADEFNSQYKKALTYKGNSVLVNWPNGRKNYEAIVKGVAVVIPKYVDINDSEYHLSTKNYLRDNIENNQVILLDIESQDGYLHTIPWDFVVEKKITVKLNGNYDAIVTKEYVKVGCQSFTHESIREVLKAMDEVNS
jgi:hypothetical protein